MRKRKRHHDDGDAEEVVLLGKDKFRIETYMYLPILDRLSAELNRRVQAYDKIQSLFGFLVEFPSKTDDELRQATEIFRENYPDIYFQEEMVHFKLVFRLAVGKQYRHRNPMNIWRNARSKGIDICCGL